MRCLMVAREVMERDERERGAVSGSIHSERERERPAPTAVCDSGRAIARARHSPAIVHK